MTRKRFPAKALMAKLLEHDGRCAECCSKLGGVHGSPEWDHRIPLQLGGDDALDNLQPLCKLCHGVKTKADVKHIAKSKRMRQREAGIKRQPRAVLPGSKASKFKRKIDGSIVPR